MTTGAPSAALTVEQHILQVLQQLKIRRAHFAGRLLGDWRGLATTHPELVSSLTLVCPWGLDAVAAKGLGARLQVVLGHGPVAERYRAALTSVPEAGHLILKGHPGAIRAAAEAGGPWIRWRDAARRA